MISITQKASLFKVFIGLWSAASVAAFFFQPNAGYAVGFGLATSLPGGMALFFLRSDKDKAVKMATIMTVVVTALLLAGSLRP